MRHLKLQLKAIRHKLLFLDITKSAWAILLPALVAVVGGICFASFYGFVIPEDNAKISNVIAIITVYQIVLLSVPVSIIGAVVDAMRCSTAELQAACRDAKLLPFVNRYAESCLKLNADGKLQ